MSGRRNNDHYGAAPEVWATRELLKYINPDPNRSILEPCSGRGHIEAALRERWDRRVLSNDIDPGMDSHLHLDAFNDDLYKPRPDWIITNPPFDKAPLLVPIWFREARMGVACLLRLTFLEPVGNRWLFLEAHPPDRLIVLPRMSFTGDGKTDSVTCAWFIWAEDGQLGFGRPIEVATPKQDNGRLSI